MVDKYNVGSTEMLANEAQVFTQFPSFDFFLFLFCNSFTLLNVPPLQCTFYSTVFLSTLKTRYYSSVFSFSSLVPCVSNSKEKTSGNDKTMVDKYNVESAETLANEAQVLTQFPSFDFCCFSFAILLPFIYLFFF
jgi:hypothetical protein